MRSSPSSLPNVGFGMNALMVLARSLRVSGAFSQTGRRKPHLPVDFFVSQATTAAKPMTMAITTTAAASCSFDSSGGAGLYSTGLVTDVGFPARSVAVTSIELSPFRRLTLLLKLPNESTGIGLPPLTGFPFTVT
jgi:hypothetical protein